MSGSGKLPREQRIEREKEAWELRLQGRSHSQIAEVLGVDRTTVTKLLQRVRKRKQAKTDGDVDQHRSEQIARYEKIYEESMTAWEASKQASKTAIRKKITGGKFAGEEESIKVEEAHGDPRFLATAMNSLAQLQKLVGVDTQPRPEDNQSKMSNLSAEDRAARLKEIISAGRDREKQKLLPNPIYVEKSEQDQLVQ